MYQKKKIVILGMARSGVAAAKILARDNTVIINDLKEEENDDKKVIKELKGLGCELILGSHPDDLINESVDLVVKNPGIRDDHKYIKKVYE